MLYYFYDHTVGGESCFESVVVQQRGNLKAIYPSQVIIPRANFTCNGRITAVTVSMDRIAAGVNDPYLEVWHPTTPDNSVFDKVSEVQLVESEIVQVGHDLSTAYWLVDIILNDDDRIDFEAGDLIGFYHPPDSRYTVWTIDTVGYTAYGHLLDNALNFINLTTIEGDINNLQPLIQITVGK